MNKKRNNKGFSLVELIVVIAVMAVLVVVLAPAYLRYVDKARVQKDVSAVSEIVQSIKIAAAEETVSKEITSSGITVKVDTNGVISVDGETVTATGVTDDNKETALGKEIRATVGETLKFTSSTLKGQQVTISVKQDDVDYGLIIDVTGAADGLNGLDENVPSTSN